MNRTDRRRVYQWRVIEDYERKREAERTRRECRIEAREVIEARAFVQRERTADEATETM